MKHESIIGLLTIVMIVAGCQGGGDTDKGGFESPVAESHLDPDDPTLLRRPFTAEQIREEFVVGLSIDMRHRTPEKEFARRWTVISSDEESVVIAYADLDENDVPAAEADLKRSSWTELRDHANFPAATATRETVTRDTPLGKLDGWLYTVPDAEAGSVTEFFFARDYPGAPVTMTITRGDEVLLEMEQSARDRPVN